MRYDFAVARDDRTFWWFLAVVALLASGSAFATVLVLTDDDDPQPVGLDDVTSTSGGVSSTTTAESGRWFVVLRSDVDATASRDAFAATVAEYGERGAVIDTDDYRTGDASPPDFYPRAGVVAAVVGPFRTHDDAQAWCNQNDAGGCSIRQLIPA